MPMSLVLCMVCFEIIIFGGDSEFGYHIISVSVKSAQNAHTLKRQKPKRQRKIDKATANASPIFGRETVITCNVQLKIFQSVKSALHTVTITMIILL